MTSAQQWLIVDSNMMSSGPERPSAVVTHQLSCHNGRGLLRQQHYRTLQRHILTTAYLVRRIIRCGMAPRVRSIIARCSKLSCVCIRHGIHITTQSHWYTVLFANNKSCRYTCLILAIRLHTLSWFSQNLPAAWRYGDGAGNIVEENSSVFSLIRMC